MGEYSIQETTLIGIGDALRRRHGETKKAIVKDYAPVVVISKTSNATNSNTFNGGYPNNANVYDVVQIPNATKISVRLYTQTEGIDYDWVQVASGALDSTTFPSNATKYGGSAGITFWNLEFENTDTITFYFRTDSSGSNYLGYYAECSGYDIDGNVILSDELVDVEIDVPNTYSSAEMATAIDNIETGVVIPEEELSYTGKDLENRFKDAKWDWVIKCFGDKITTSNLTSIQSAFLSSYVENIPFALNLSTSCSNTSQVFQGCNQLKNLPDINGTMNNSYAFMSNCTMVRYLPDSWATGMNWSKVNKTTSWLDCRIQDMFRNCHSLREIPEELLKKIYHSSNTSTSMGTMFENCYALNKLVGFRGPNATLTSNMFSGMFSNLSRINRFVFDMEDGSPRVQSWQAQTIDLSTGVGYLTTTPANILVYNSGITSEKEVYDDTTYQLLKDDEDMYSTKISYSRYNHNSAVETINSLPDCSAYLVSSSGTANIIKFTGASGSATDGGAINTMTEEEIAVATAKGWTVSLV